MHLSSTRGIKSEPIQDKIITPISITNGNVLPIQLFYQSTSNILDMPLDPGDNAIRLFAAIAIFINFVRFPNGKLPRDDSNRALFEVFVATAKRLSIVMSLKQVSEIFYFTYVNSIFNRIYFNLLALLGSKLR